jgi:hypothetical protein
MPQRVLRRRDRQLLLRAALLTPKDDIINQRGIKVRAHALKQSVDNSRPQCCRMVVRQPTLALACCGSRDANDESLLRHEDERRQHQTRHTLLLMRSLTSPLSVLVLFYQLFKHTRTRRRWCATDRPPGPINHMAYIQD